MAGKVISEREELLICEHYTANWPLKKIAAYANVSQTTVMAVLKRRGITLRNGKRITPVQEEEVIKLYNEDVSILNIISRTGIKSEQTIYRILRDANVKRRRDTKHGGK